MTLKLSTQPDLDIVEDKLQACFATHPLELVRNIAQHSLYRQGKRIRASMVLLFSRMLNYQGTEHHVLATIIELLHGATLLHDDVIDQSDLRRHHPTAHTIWGNKASILMGDLVYAKAFTLISTIQEHSIIAKLAESTTTICSGEIHQLTNRGNFDTTMTEYYKIIEAKTATLFASACACATLLCQPHLYDKAYSFGHHFGMAYQMTDDLLDLTPNNPDFGKNMGDDLRDGKITGPIIALMQTLDATAKNELINLLNEPTEANIALIQKSVHDHQAHSIVQQTAQSHIDQATQILMQLPQNNANDDLNYLTQFIANRKS